MSIELILGSLVGIFLSIPVSLGLLLALTREPRVQVVTRVVEVAAAQGEIKVV